MLNIKEMTRDEMLALLARLNFGHLGCARDGHPYVVPMNYAFEPDALYFLTTDGTKTEYMAANTEVCFQVEEVDGPQAWRSVMVTGRAERLSKPEEMERAMQLIASRNPSLAPALSETKIGAWRRPSNLSVYRVRPEAIYGRRTA